MTVNSENTWNTKKHQAIWNLGVSELPIHPTHQPNWRWVIYFGPSRIRALWPAWPCMVFALIKMFLQCKAFPVGSWGSAGEEVERLGMLVQVTNINRSWSKINGVTTTVNYYYQVIKRCQNSCCTGEEREGSKTKALNPPPLVLSRGQLQQVGKTDSAGIEIPWLDMASTSSTSVHALKKRCLQIKPGSGLYTAMEFHTLTIVNIILSNKWIVSRKFMYNVWVANTLLLFSLHRLVKVHLVQKSSSAVLKPVMCKYPTTVNNNIHFVAKALLFNVTPYGRKSCEKWPQ